MSRKLVPPVIKGIFVNSHIKALRDRKGEAAVQELERRFGRPLRFRNFDNVPVSDEVKIIEHVLDLISDAPVPPAERAFEAGRLHFRNFSTTPFGRIMFSTLPRDFKRMVMGARYIASHVFQNVRFTAEDLGPKTVRVTMENNNYPLDHFRGLFFEWMTFFGLRGRVEAAETSPNTFVYTMEWD